MNKQEALESVLAKVRQYEREDQEVRSEDPGMVEEKLLELARGLDTMVATLVALDEAGEEPEMERLEGRIRAQVLDMAACCVYLLVDEVTVVEAPPPQPSPPQVKLGTVTINPAAYEPTAINGLAAGLAYARELQERGRGRA